MKHPADDGNLWFIREGDRDLQFDCHPGGLPPFLVEGGDDERIEATNVGEAMAAIDRLLE